MPDSEAKKRWNRENTTKISITMHNKHDKDLLDYLEDKQKSTEIKRLLRIALEKPNKPALK